MSILLLAIALAASGPTPEEAKLLRPVKDAPTVQLDLNGAYILLRSPAPAAINLFRVATPADIEDYRQRRTKALAKAHDKWVKKHKEWERSVSMYGSASVVSEPIEPTDESLDFQPLDQENLLGFGPLNRFAKADGTSTYLQRVWPGRYVLYGSILVNPKGGAAGVCVCMGTVAFDANAGEITDVGTVFVNGIDPIINPRMLEKAKPEDLDGLRTGDITMIRLKPSDSSMPVDPRLASYKVVPAVFRAAGPVPNYYGVQVDRLTAMPGVFSYNRDKIVDLTGGIASGH